MMITMCNEFQCKSKMLYHNYPTVSRPLIKDCRERASSKKLTKTEKREERANKNDALKKKRKTLMLFNIDIFRCHKSNVNADF